ncbi:MAG: PAS domain S-box protein [Geobacteraceae bacterium]
MFVNRNRLAQALKSGSQSIRKLGRQRNGGEFNNQESSAKATQNSPAIKERTERIQGEYDLTTGVISWPVTITNLLGLTETTNQTTFQEFLSHYSATDTEAALAAIESTLIENASTEVVLSIRNAPLGGARHRVTFRPLADGYAGTRKALCQVQDITEIKSFSPCTRSPQHITSRLEDSIRDVLFRVSLPDGTFEHISRGVAQITGYPAETWYQKPFLLLELILPAWRAKFEREFKKYLHGYSQEEQTFPIQHPEGKIRWIQLRTTLLKDEKGELLAIEGIASDITERKQEEMERIQLVRDLKKALDEVKTLSGLLPICSFCKKVRDDQGYWKQIESYITEHSELFFTHGLCPDCLTYHYPEYFSAHETKKNPTM